METRFEAEKETRLVRGRTREGDGVRGYEIHMGRTRRFSGTEDTPEKDSNSGTEVRGDHAEAFLHLEDGREDGCRSSDGRVWGTYLHGIFDLPDFRRRWLRSLGWSGSGAGPGRDLEELREAEFERLADVLEAHLDMDLLDRIIGI